MDVLWTAGWCSDTVCVCVFRVLTVLGDWLSTGGLLILAGCLASVATLVVLLCVAVCLVRWRLRRRRRKLLPPTTKIELQETPSDEPTAPTRDPLLAAEMGQLSEVTLNDFESEQVRYVVGHDTIINLIIMIVMIINLCHIWPQYVVCLMIT